MNEKIVEIQGELYGKDKRDYSWVKNCKQCNSPFDITDKDLEFYDKISPKFDGKKFDIPTPTFCPDCKLQRKLVWRNDKKLYIRKCDKTGKDIISVYSPNNKSIVYDKDYWWSDDFDATDYGIDFNFGKSFFSQFKQLLKNTPHPSLINLSCENSDFSNYIAWSKNSYLCFAGDNVNDSMYNYDIVSSDNCLDTMNMRDSSYNYEVINGINSIKTFFSRNIDDCSNSFFLKNCKGCEYCFMCFNLVNKKYCINNKQYSKQNYINFINTINLGDYKILSKYIKEFQRLDKISIKKSNNNISSFNCKGDYILNSNNCINSFFISKGCENLKNVMIGFTELKDSFDCTYSGVNSSKFYETIASGGDCYNCLFANIVIDNSSNVYYSDYCISSKNLFGCVGLKNKEYCIFNKQYSKEEYEILVSKIIENMIKAGEWGEFFPSNISPFGYNETVANEYFPLKKDEAINLNFNWSDYEQPFSKVEKIIPSSKLPDHINDIPDDILNWAVECEITKKPFKILKQELDFYRKYNLPIPRIHPDQRHLDRIKLKNPIKLFDRICDKCNKKIKTTFSPDREEIVYCKECYNKEIY